MIFELHCNQPSSNQTSLIVYLKEEEKKERDEEYDFRILFLRCF